MQLQDVFPYPSFRPGQFELANSVYATCKSGGPLVVEAMSGFGKTASVLAGSLLAVNQTGGRIIYACRTKRQVFRVLEEVQRIQKRTPLQAIYLFSKNDYCLLKEMSTFPISQESFKWYCSFNVSNNLCSYFLNLSLLNERLTSLVKQYANNAPTHSNLLAECRDLHVCPYEVARLVMAEARVIVTTYHYIFDEASRSVLLTSSSCVPLQHHADNRRGSQSERVRKGCIHVIHIAARTGEGVPGLTYTSPRPDRRLSPGNHRYPRSTGL